VLTGNEHAECIKKTAIPSLSLLPRGELPPTGGAAMLREDTTDACISGDGLSLYHSFGHGAEHLWRRYLISDPCSCG